MTTYTIPPWERALTNWVESASEEERPFRRIAETRIRESYADPIKESDADTIKVRNPDKIQTIYLNNLELTSIDGLIFPETVTQLCLQNNKIRSISNARLKNITELNLDSNKITSLSGVHFQKIKSLCVDHNEITTIAGVNFQGIEWLFLQYNKIDSIARANFQKIQGLYLNSNCITSIEGANFQGVKEDIWFNYNPITSLPMSLASLPETCCIHTENCHITPRAVIAFQDALHARRNARKPCPDWLYTIYEPPMLDPRSLQEPIVEYLSKAQDIFPNLLITDIRSSFSEEEKKLLNQFLHRLKYTADFQNPRMEGGIIFAVYQLLQAASLSAIFKTNLFALVHEALETCSDRVAITLNRIEIQRRIDTTAMDIELLIGCRRLQLVHEAVKKIITVKKLGDSIEPMLYIQNKLKKKLKLPIVTEGMLYPLLANVSNKELDDIAKEILHATSSLKQHLAILTEPLLPALSATNPFNFNIYELWERHLQEKNADEYKKIEAAFSDDDLIDPIKLNELRIKKTNLNIELTKEILGPLCCVIS